MLYLEWRFNRYKKQKHFKANYENILSFLSFLVSLDIFLSLVNISFLSLSHPFLFRCTCMWQWWLIVNDRQKSCDSLFFFFFVFYTCLSKKNTSGYGNWISIYTYMVIFPVSFSYYLSLLVSKESLNINHHINTHNFHLISFSSCSTNVLFYYF